MFKTEELRALVIERLTVAAEEIFCIFEKTLKDYEETLLRPKQEERDQERNQTGLKAPLQESVQQDDATSKQDLCVKTDLCETKLEPLQIKEEEEEEAEEHCLWTNKTSETLEEADTKASVFTIVYVPTNEEEGRELTHKNQDLQNKGDGSSELLRSEHERVSCDASEPTSDCQVSGVSDDDQRDSSGKKELPGETSGQPYTCGICSKTFRIKSILTRHMKTHTGEKPHSCSVCGKSFVQRSYLRTHMNSHTGQKPHTCVFCGRGFTQVGNMNAHMRIHTGEKRHKCCECGKSFREKAELIRHKIIHTGEKPYSCTVCNMKFNTQSNVTRHMKTHSGETPYSCSRCGKGFIQHARFIIHMRTHPAQTL